jgi:hypothetical protein
MTTIQLTLNEDDLKALEQVLRYHYLHTKDLLALAEHILQQVKQKEVTNAR